MGENRAPVAVVAGHICLDITPAFENSEPIPVSRLLRPGRLTRVGVADVHTGGCVANTGLALHRLGVPTRLIARVGADAFGRLIGELLAAEGADVRLKVDEAGSTSYSVVIAPPGVDRMFLHHAGANEAFGEADVPDALLSGAKLLHFGYPPMMLTMLRDGGAQLLALFARARALGLATSLDMVAFDPASEAGRIDWPALLARLLPMVDFFLPSAEELCLLLDAPLHAEWLARAGGGDVTETLDIARDIAPLAVRLLRMGVKVALIKCGARGLYYQAADDAAIRGIPLPFDSGDWADACGFVPAYRPRKVVSATGAGDTCIAAYLASALEGLPPLHCAQRAAATGACCVEAYDALSGLLPLAEIDRRIASGWAHNE
jgi:sugar/nucleoside kinase (ribokinase family)